MTTITSFGKPSYGYEYIKDFILRQAKKAGIKFTLKEITDVKEFIAHDIESIPAFRIDGEYLFKSKSQDLSSFAEEVGFHLLKKANFGSLKKLIIPVDFSSTSDNALAYGVQLNKKVNGIIDLVHVYYPNAKQQKGQLIIDENSEESRKNRLQELAAAVKDKWIGDDKMMLLDTVFLQGFAADKILEVSAKNKNSLIIMGSTGQSGLLKKLFGSVSTKVARNCTNPVLLIPDEYAFKPYENIVYCASDGNIDAATFTSLIEFVRPFNSNVHLLHIGKNDGYDGQKVLDMWKEFYPEENLVFTQIESKNRIDAIDEYCYHNNIDLISLSTKNKGFVDRVFRKSMTKELCIYASTPLLVLHT